MQKFTKPTASGKTPLILYGRHAVIAALTNPRRQISKILCTAESAAELKPLAAKRSLAPVIVERKELDRILPREAVHQGFALYCSPLPSASLEDICALAEQQETCHVLVLDQVTDPQNIGAIIRSCVAFNTLALIVQDKNSPAETGAMAKAAAGMLEHLPVCRATNLSRAIQKLKDAGFWTIGMDGYAETTIDSLKKGGRTAVIMGSEGKGMRRLVEESCDTAVRLPISPLTESLNVSTAAAIALYELNRK